MWILGLKGLIVCFFKIQLQSNPLNMDTERVLDSVRNNGVSVLSRLIQRKHKGFLSPGTKQTVRNDEECYMYSRIP